MLMMLLKPRAHLPNKLHFPLPSLCKIGFFPQQIAKLLLVIKWNLTYHQTWKAAVISYLPYLLWRWLQAKNHSPLRKDSYLEMEQLSAKKTFPTSLKFLFNSNPFVPIFTLFENCWNIYWDRDFFCSFWDCSTVNG